MHEKSVGECRQMTIQDVFTDVQEHKVGDLREWQTCYDGFRRFWNIIAHRTHSVLSHEV